MLLPEHLDLLDFDKTNCALGMHCLESYGASIGLWLLI